MLYGKNIVLGITGGIAAYKSCEVVSRLVKLGANVDVIMTKHAEEFVTPLTFETLSGNRVITNMFDRDFEYDVKHVSLAKKADIFVVAPATANILAKFVCGVADDMLTTTWLASKCTKLIAPAMNTAMLEDEATEDNLKVLAERGVRIVESGCGRLACGDTGRGKMAEPENIVDAVEKLLQPKNDFKDKTLLITSGATEEEIDKVRVITNHSSGKMGCALATAATERGASVIFVYGNMTENLPTGIMKAVKVKSTEDMLSAVVGNMDEADAFIMAAAPADYRVKNVSSQKIKAEKLMLEFEKNPDIARAVGEKKGNKKLVIFSAETESLIDNAKGKLQKKNADLVVANDVTKEGAGFGTDTNIASIIGNDGNIFESGLISKRELADLILDRLANLFCASGSEPK